MLYSEIWVHPENWQSIKGKAATKNCGVFKDIINQDLKTENLILTKSLNET